MFKKKKNTLKISRTTDAIWFYILNSSYDASWETSCDASHTDRHKKQWRYFNIIFLERLVWSTVKLLKWFLKLKHFYAQINKGHLRKVGGYSGWNVVTANNNKDKDTSLKKNHTKYCILDDNTICLSHFHPYLTAEHSVLLVFR